MEQEKITYFLAVYARYYPEEKIPEIIEKLKALPDESFVKLNNIPKKDPLSVLTYSFYLGFFGVDRMMIGEMVKGLFKLVIFGSMCIFAYYIIDRLMIGTPAKVFLFVFSLLVGSCWPFVEWFKIEKLTKEYNYRKIIELL